MKYETLDAIGDAFINATDNETEALFEQGRIVLAGVQSGFAVDDVTRHCAGLVRRTMRTIYRRYAVARTFPNPHPELTWEFHGICSDLVDYRQNDEIKIAQEQAQAREWLQRAAEEHYSTRTLRAALLAAGNRVEEKLIVWLDGVPGHINDVKGFVDGTTLITIYFKDLAVSPPLEDVQVTLVKAPSVEEVKS